MIYTTSDIEGRILELIPRTKQQNSLFYDSGKVGPASIDLAIGFEADFMEESKGVIGPDCLKKSNWKPRDLEQYTSPKTNVSYWGWYLHPGEPMLVPTMEWVEIPVDVSAFVVGRSTMGRLFVQVHQTAGFIDPGFKGAITLEVMNASKSTIFLSVGMKVCQLVVFQNKSPSSSPYKSKFYSENCGLHTPKEMSVNEIPALTMQQIKALKGAI